MTSNGALRRQSVPFLSKCLEYNEQHGEGCALTFNVLLMVVVMLLIRYHSSRAEDLLKALDPQSFVQVPIVLLFNARSPM